MLKAIIIDDEIAALRSLEMLLQNYCKNVNVVGKGQSVEEGIGLIKQFNPDIVFLDIEMPHGNGFELLEQTPDHCFEVIFITAYNQYAIKAFKYSAIDYILKPIDIDELVNAVEKASNLLKNQVNPRERYAALFQNIKEILPHKLVVPCNDGFKYIDLNNVLHLSLEKDSVKFYLCNNSVTECIKLTSDINDILIEKGFVSINNGIMVNLNKVLKVDKAGKGMVILEGNHTVPLDSYSKETFIEQLTAFNIKKFKT